MSRGAMGTGTMAPFCLSSMVLVYVVFHKEISTRRINYLRRGLNNPKRGSINSEQD